MSYHIVPNLVAWECPEREVCMYVSEKDILGCIIRQHFVDYDRETLLRMLGELRSSQRQLSNTPVELMGLYRIQCHPITELNGHVGRCEGYHDEEKKIVILRFNIPLPTGEQCVTIMDGFLVDIPTNDNHGDE